MIMFVCTDKTITGYTGTVCSLAVGEEQLPALWWSMCERATQAAGQGSETLALASAFKSTFALVKMKKLPLISYDK